MVVRRFLLDQGFPKPPKGLGDLDASVEYVHLSDEAPHLSQASTPDWLLYLEAAHRGFAGLVTADVRQVRQETELVALTRTDLCVVTWKAGHNDPTMKWGQLLTYMPQVVRRLEGLDTRGAVVITLPSPVLPASGVARALNLARALSEADQVSFPERRTEQLRLMRADLQRRGAIELLPLLGD